MVINKIICRISFAILIFIFLYQLMHLYKTSKGILLDKHDAQFIINGTWDEIINRENLHDYLLKINAEKIAKNDFEDAINTSLQTPLGTQELWAAGVTYLRSRNARMEESEQSGASDFYQKVYEADRPELFFKALPHRVSAHNEKVFIRKDSSWNVPEPELTLYINSFGNIQGYTIGNDMSSRDIEGENPLYLPQAKMYERSAALGPCLYIPQQPISQETVINILIERNGNEMFKESIQINRMKRSLTELAGWLYRECTFNTGCYLMTGTGMVPPNDFTLLPGDMVTINIENIGTLINTVAHNNQK
jgi:2-dehydro-3-deoxy-D-arabinonate dehydratase